MILPIYEHIMQENRKLRALVERLKAELAQLREGTKRESEVVAGDGPERNPGRR